MSPLWEGGAKGDVGQPFKNPPKSPFAKGEFQRHAFNAGLGPQPNQCSGFGFQDLGLADTYNPIPDESSGFTLATHLRILRRRYDLRLYLIFLRSV